MLFDLVFIGFGVITTQVLSELLRKKFKKKLNIAIIEKDISNFPGGVAYSLDKSKYGYFNNPLRLSNKEFVAWVKKEENLNKLKRFVKKNKKYELINWFNTNKKALEKKNLSEIYLPRLVYSFFLEEKAKNFLPKINKNIKLKIFSGNVISLKKKNYYSVKTKSNLNSCSFKLKNNNLFLKKKKITNSNIVKGKRIVLGLGILPPKEVNFENYINKNYIWDFYSEGGTSKLLSKIKKIKKKQISVVFIGNKAGLLEPMQKIKSLIYKNKKNINLISIAPNLISLEKAILSTNHQKLKLKYFNSKKIHNLNKSEKILYYLIKEFKLAKKRKFKKYDVWTKILKGNFLNIVYKKLPKKEKKKYNLKILNLIRNITRFTYPETVIAKQNLQRIKKLKFIKGRIKSIIPLKKFMVVVISKQKRIYTDIVVNVSGPRKITDKSSTPSLIDFLKNYCYNYSEKGFYAKEDFAIGDNIFSPGTLSLNFNPLRQTIIKAISLNSNKTARKLYLDINK